MSPPFFVGAAPRGRPAARARPAPGKMTIKP
jgi:hypothetical protein